eukprot:TRINITY_DN7861_c0_g1_i6.p1 TRINITY_DN7861_c0_g1~~TRINITY_DN7861_c0_g1_i6.p1  ORF type:complete len:133 (+),score=16.84 TRINITY_DN7861_c0_g1_i6:790-1188(+)
MVPLFIYFVFSILILLYNLHQVRNLNKMIKRMAAVEQNFDIQKQLIKYTVVFVVFWTPPLVDAILSIFEVNNAYSDLFNSLSVALQSLANSVVWGTSPDFVALFQRKGENQPLVDHNNIYTDSSTVSENSTI